MSYQCTRLQELKNKLFLLFTIFRVVLAVIVCLVICGTLYDVWYREVKKGKKNQISLNPNIPKIIWREICINSIIFICFFRRTQIPDFFADSFFGIHQLHETDHPQQGSWATGVYPWDKGPLNLLDYSGTSV